MNYLALGDSISIDDYTGLPGVGAASQFARLIGATTFQNRTRDGCTTDGVLENLRLVSTKPDVVTITAGGNDFLLAASYGENPTTDEGRIDLVDRPLANLAQIAERVNAWNCPVILNTIYDPTDGDDALGQSLGISPSYRRAFYDLNDGIRTLARSAGFLLADLHSLFLGHGIAATDSWIVGQIEPNLAGATAVARHWHTLYPGP